MQLFQPKGQHKSHLSFKITFRNYISYLSFFHHLLRPSLLCSSNYSWLDWTQYMKESVLQYDVQCMKSWISVFFHIQVKSTVYTVWKDPPSLPSFTSLTVLLSLFWWHFWGMLISFQPFFKKNIQNTENKPVKGSIPEVDAHLPLDHELISNSMPREYSQAGGIMKNLECRKSLIS